MIWFIAFLITAYWVDPLPWLDEVALALLLVWFRFDLAVLAAIVIGGVWLFGDYPPVGLLENPEPAWWPV